MDTGQSSAASGVTRADGEDGYFDYPQDARSTTEPLSPYLSLPVDHEHHWVEVTQMQDRRERLICTEPTCRAREWGDPR